MSERSFRRERERRIATQRRRDAFRKRRAGLVGGIAIGAFALAPTAAHAANFEVNTLNDGAPDPSPGACTTDPNGCTLREAINDSNISGTDDAITFQTGLTGTITLDQGPLFVNKSTGNSTTITGPGADDIYVSGGGISLVFDVQTTGGAGLTISGLTIGDGSDDVAGGIYVEQGAEANLTDSTVTGNVATGTQVGKYAFAGGGGITNRGSMTIDNSEISGNYANTADNPSSPVPYGGGGGIDNLGRMTISGSTITENGSRYFGGGILDGISKYPTQLDISDTTISNNGASYGGGIASFNFPASVGSSHHTVTNSTIAENQAGFGGGASFSYVGGSSEWSISHSTVSGNQAEAGAGLGFKYDIGPFTLVDSTISGNDAEFAGGGAYIARGSQKYSAPEFNNSTIASNSAGDLGGGGLYLGYTEPGSSYSSPELFSTIVGNNTAGSGPNDLFQETDTNGTASSFDLSFSLVRSPGNAVFTQTPAGSNIFGVDPQLNPLADNGGPTETMLPATTSPAVDKGSAPGNLTTDQRGLPRTVDTSVANAHDGTDIGAVELPTGPPGPPPPPPAAGGTKVGSLKKKHKKRRRVIRTRNKTAKIRLTFRTANAGVTFQCSVDGRAFAPCTSPFTTKVSSGPGKGKNHSIAIKQVDAAGNQVGNVRVFRFRVVLKD